MKSGGWRDFIFASGSFRPPMICRARRIWEIDRLFRGRMADLGRSDGKERNPVHRQDRVRCPGIGKCRRQCRGPAQHTRPFHPGRHSRRSDTSTQILRRNRFSYIVPGQERGNLGYGTFRKDGIQNLNVALAKGWSWGAARAYAVRFRAEAYNVTNHPQFDQPQYNVSSPSFGKITNTLNDGRILQFGLRLLFSS